MFLKWTNICSLYAEKSDFCVYFFHISIFELVHTSKGRYLPKSKYILMLNLYIAAPTIFTKVIGPDHLLTPIFENQYSTYKVVTKKLRV